MENMDKGLTVPKWVLINRPKIPKRPKIYLPKLSAQAQKFWDFDEKSLRWASVVRDWPKPSQISDSIS